MGYPNRRYRVKDGKLEKRWDGTDDPEWFMTKAEARAAVPGSAPVPVSVPEPAAPPEPPAAETPAAFASSSFVPSQNVVSRYRTKAPSQVQMSSQNRPKAPYL